MKTAARSNTGAPASTSTTSRRVQESIAGAIGDGEFMPGTPLVEATLAARFGVSRVPVREALRALEQDGLVVHVPRKGRFVAPLSTQDVEEVFFLREVLEIAAARLSYQRITEEELDALALQLDALTPGLSPRQDYFSADVAVHDAIARKAGNRRLLAMLQQLNSQIERARRTSAMQCDRLARSVREHQEIVEALRLRDLPLVKARLRVHLRNVKEATMEVCRTILRD
jgi:DNA-binding GntR family transcriptional regulator